MKPSLRLLRTDAARADPFKLLRGEKYDCSAARGRPDPDAAREGTHEFLPWMSSVSVWSIFMRGCWILGRREDALMFEAGRDVTSAILFQFYKTRKHIYSVTLCQDQKNLSTNNVFKCSFWCVKCLLKLRYHLKPLHTFVVIKITLKRTTEILKKHLYSIV